MREKILDYKEGSFLMISSGEYRDYEINGLFKVLKDFNANDQLLAWAEETDRKLVNMIVQRDSLNKNINYTDWLNKNGFIEYVQHRELHIGCYGQTKLFDYTSDT